MDFFDGLTIAFAHSIPHHQGVTVNVPQYYSIQFNFSGNFFLKVGSRKELHAHGPHAFLTYPGEQFIYGTHDSDGRHHCFVCTCGPRIEKYLESGLFPIDPENPLIPIADADSFLHTLNQLIHIRQRNHADSPRTVLLFEDLLLQLHEARRNKNDLISGHTRKLRELADKITAAPEQEYDFASFAIRCGITLIHFRRLFKELTGLPPQQFLQQMRLQKAAELLVSTTLSVKEIAYQTAWEDEYYFSRQFRKKYQLPPREYRKESISKE